MNKTLTALLLALGVMYAAPAAAQVQSGHLYIQDPTAPVVITYGIFDATLFNNGISNSAYTNTLYIGALNENGTLINFEWVPLLKSVGNGNTDTAALGYCSDCLMNTNVYEYTPATGTVELVFFWGNEHQTFYSAVYDEGKWRNPVDASGNKWDMITYTATGATVGFEDGGGTPKCLNCKSDWDWNDVVITLTNVGAAPPSVIPEPETYAMLLAGLGVVGAVVRRRRIA